jgi:putative PIN family toxin of toxin-antitoxin system
VLRAVIDTNVWVSALLNPRGHPALILGAIRKRRFVPILSQPLVEELIDVLGRPRIVDKYKLEPEEVAEYTALLVERAEIVSPPGDLHLCRDPRDDMVLETAIVGKASCLVSRDDDIKADEELVREMGLRGVKVLSVASFLALVSGESGSGRDPA